MADPSPLERALCGDEDALDRVLAGVVAPIFDVAWHLRPSRDLAADAAVSAVRALRDEIHQGILSAVDPLIATGRHLLALTPPVQRDHPTHGFLHALPPPLQAAALMAAGLGLDDGELALALDLTPSKARARLCEALEHLGLTRAELETRLDALAANAPFPRDLMMRVTDDEDDAASEPT